MVKPDGEAKVGIALVDVRVDAGSTDRKRMFIVGAICHGEIEAIEDIWFDERLAVNNGGTIQAPFDGTETPATLDSFRNKDLSTGDAQRRPGPRPRRHVVLVHVGAVVDPRSTKAGAETPATHARMSTFAPSTEIAQRRPGPRPRRHSL